MCSQAVAVEGGIGSLLGAPIVGLLSEEVFGYVRTTLHVSELAPDVRLLNATALGNSLACLTTLPWAISFIVYGIVHFTYGRDRESLAVRQNRTVLRGSSVADGCRMHAHVSHAFSTHCV